MILTIQEAKRVTANDKKQIERKIKSVEYYLYKNPNDKNATKKLLSLKSDLELANSYLKHWSAVAELEPTDNEDNPLFELFRGGNMPVWG
jgi:hypothetical protein